MKKLLLSIAVIASAMSANAQVDTLREFFTGTPTLYGAQGGGIVTGTNAYDDIAKGMRFNSQTGLTNGGVLNGVLLALPVINDAGGSFDVTVYAYGSATALGAELGSVTIDIADVDTTLATGWQVAENAVVYNVAAMFAAPITIPASKDIMVMVKLPTTFAAGDSIAILSNTSGNFALAGTHTWEVWSDNSLNDFATAWQGGVNVAMAIYPVVDFVASVEDFVVTSSVYPNPATNELNIVVNGEEIENVSIVTMDGKTVLNSTSDKVDVSSLLSGMYMYNVTTVSGNISTGNFVKK